MSYGMSRLFNVMTETCRRVMQGAAVQFPLKFDRQPDARPLKPKDGQLYVTGLKGWQTNAGHEGALHRVRYRTSQAGCRSSSHAHKNGLSIHLRQPARQSHRHRRRQLGHRTVELQWTANYGSPGCRSKNPTKGQA